MYKDNDICDWRFFFSEKSDKWVIPNQHLPLNTTADSTIRPETRDVNVSVILYPIELAFPLTL
jgi:hypothetical protein